MISQNPKNTEELKEMLFQEVLYQIQTDIENRDFEALDELMRFIPIKNLIQYLPEENWGPFLTLKKDEF